MKKKLIAALLGLCLVTPGCLGPNNAYNSIRNWNAEVSNHDWLNEVVFLAMVIVPVYGIAQLGDYLIFNTIGYWGKNPINDPGPFPSSWGNKGESGDKM